MDVFSSLADGFVIALTLEAYMLGMMLLWIRDRTLQKYLDFASL